MLFTFDGIDGLGALFWLGLVGLLGICALTWLLRKSYAVATTASAIWLGAIGISLLVVCPLSERGLQIYKQIAPYVGIGLFVVVNAPLFIYGPLRKRLRARSGLCPHCGVEFPDDPTECCSNCGRISKTRLTPTRSPQVERPINVAGRWGKAVITFFAVWFGIGIVFFFIPYSTWDSFGISGSGQVVAFWLGILPAYIVARTAFLRIRQNQVDSDHRFCSVCGYDLTGNVSRICPECGASLAEHQEN